MKKAFFINYDLSDGWRVSEYPASGDYDYSCREKVEITLPDDYNDDKDSLYATPKNGWYKVYLKRGYLNKFGDVDYRIQPVKVKVIETY